MGKIKNFFLWFTKARKIKFDENDLITDIDSQVHFLVEERGLKIETSVAELKHLISNYGYNSLFRKYSVPFLEEIDGAKSYKANTSEMTILKLYYFDYTLTNILMNYIGSFEFKLTSNIFNQVCQECPKFKKQLSYMVHNVDQQNHFIKLVKQASRNGSDYLNIFVNKNIYPGSVILAEMTLGNKLFVFKRLKNVDLILKNFYLSEFSKKEFFTIIFDFVRPLRNIVAHFDRLFKYSITLNSQQSELFKKLVTHYIKDEKYANQVLDKNAQKLDTFDLILILLFLLGSTRAKAFVQHLKDFIKHYQHKNGRYFNVNNLLTDRWVYNWPHDWSLILDHVLANKIN